MYRIKMLETDYGLVKDKEYIARFIEIGLNMAYVYDLEGNLVCGLPDNELLYEMVI